MFDPKGQKLDMFGSAEAVSPRVVDQEIFGGNGIEIPDSGRVVAKPTPIMAIHADPKQPRRALPITIRMHWDGNPLDVTGMLAQWQSVAEAAYGQSIPLEALLNGEGEGFGADDCPPITQDYLALVRLARSIKAKPGLINPITIIQSDDKLVIETGERRWLSYHLLHLTFGDEWVKIPAAKGDAKNSAWLQAEENTQRRQLNAVSMARQLALLIMAARGEESYKPFEEVVSGGASDRRFYAQVADGNIHRIPRGMGERLQSAMGIGMEQLSQYRRLLRLTDDELVNDGLWTAADVGNWPESTLRELATLPTGKVRDVISRANWTLDDLKALKDAPAPQRPPVTSEWMHKRVRTKGNQFGTVVGVAGEWVDVEFDAGGRSSFVHTDLTIIVGAPTSRPAVTYTPPAPAPQRSTSIPGFSHDFVIGDMVRTRTGSEGEIVGLSGRLVSVKTKNGTTSHDYSLLTKIVTPVITEDMIEPDVDPDAPAPVQEWREGWTDGEGGNNESASDKADSVGHPEPKRILKFGSVESNFLFKMQEVAKLLNDIDTTNLINDLITMTDVQAIALADEQALKPKLDTIWKQMGESVEGWLTNTFAVVLQQIEEAAQ